MQSSLNQWNNAYSNYAKEADVVNQIQKTLSKEGFVHFWMSA